MKERKSLAAVPLQEFYERVYASAPAEDVRELVRSFVQQPGNSRTARAVAMVEQDGGTLLDVGCGDGRLLFAMKHRVDRAIGLEISTPQLKRARSWIANDDGSTHLCRADLNFQGLPLRDGCIDVATGIVILEFVLYPAALLDEINRVLRPGGTLIVSVGNLASWRNRIRLLSGAFPATSRCGQTHDGRVLHFFTESTLRDALSAAGFLVQRVSCSGRFWRVREKWASLLGGDIMIRATKPK